MPMRINNKHETLIYQRHPINCLTLYDMFDPYLAPVYTAFSLAE
jgi:hypothetical protein